MLHKRLAGHCPGATPIEKQKQTKTNRSSNSSSGRGRSYCRISSATSSSIIGSSSHFRDNSSSIIVGSSSDLHGVPLEISGGGVGSLGDYGAHRDNMDRLFHFLRREMGDG